MTTTNHNIWTPTGTTQMTPIQAPFATLAQSVDDALTVTEGLIGSRPVPDQATRATLFPTPKQGDSVYRLDRGWVERYYSAYNATSNPGGRPSAGWYAPSGTLLNVVKDPWPDTASESTSPSSPYIIRRLTVPDPGVPYRIQAYGGAEAGSSAAGTRWDLGISITAVGGSDVNTDSVGWYTGGEDIAYKAITSIPSGSVFTGTKDVVVWLGRIYGNADGKLGKFNHRLSVAVWAA